MPFSSSLHCAVLSVPLHLPTLPPPFTCPLLLSFKGRLEFPSEWQEKNNSYSVHFSPWARDRERARRRKDERERGAVKRKSKKRAEERNESSNKRDDIWRQQRVHWWCSDVRFRSASPWQMFKFTSRLNQKYSAEVRRWSVVVGFVFVGLVLDLFMCQLKLDTPFNTLQI